MLVRDTGIEPVIPHSATPSWITAVAHEQVRYFRYHVVFQRIRRSVRSDRPLRNIGRLISGVERNIQSGLLGVPVEEFELDLDHVVEALAPLVDVVVAARDCGALRRSRSSSRHLKVSVPQSEP